MKREKMVTKNKPQLVQAWIRIDHAEIIENSKVAIGGDATQLLNIILDFGMAFFKQMNYEIVHLPTNKLITENELKRYDRSMHDLCRQFLHGYKQLIDEVEGNESGNYHN
jgi:hypothetical protein